MEKPEIEFPGGEPPTELVITDLVIGDGAEAKPGGQVEVHYVGVDFETGSSSMLPGTAASQSPSRSTGLLPVGRREFPE